MEYIPKHKVNRIKFSRNFLSKELRIKGVLKCTYCTGTNLIVQYDSSKYISPTKKATIDHVIPLSKGGKMYDTNNLVIACERCNSKKGNMGFEEFLNSL